MRFRWVLLLFSLLLSACDTESTTYAPVTEISTIQPIPKSGMHRVTPNESLYEIAWRYGLDYRYLAVQNQLSAPYSVHPGQVIYLRGKNKAPIQSDTIISKNIIKLPEKSHPLADQKQSSARPEKKEEELPLLAIKETQEPNYSTSKWIWPAQGKVISSFYTSHKGINIHGNLGERVVAAAAGKVVYCGDGLRGYGNLIIIKHNSLYLSAYAHNRRSFVKEGQWVKQGQKIAEMGNTGATKVMLHFEIRRAGNPVNPLTLLNAH